MLYNILDHKAVTKHSYFGARSEDTLTCPDTGKEITRWENAANDFLSRYIEPLDSYRRLLVAMDMGSEYRKAFFPEYKANRKKRAEEQSPLEREQMAKFDKWSKRLLSALGATMIGVEGVEADDVIAWLCEGQSMMTVVHTVDADLIQLVSPSTAVSLKGETYYDGDTYKGLPTELTSVMKSMVGDTSDGYKGVPGFGPKAFDQLLEELGVGGVKDLQRIVDDRDLQALEEKAARHPDCKPLAKLVSNWGEWMDQWRLAKLHPELCWKPRRRKLTRPTIHKRVPDKAKLKAILAEVGATDMWESKLCDWVPTSMAITADNWDEWIDIIKSEMVKSDIIAFDYESSDKEQIERFREAAGNNDFVDVLSQEIAGVSFCFGEQLENLIYIPVDHADTQNVSKDQLASLIQWIKDEGKRLVAQNFSFEGTLTQTNLGIELADVWDTKIMQRYVDENSPSGLKFMSKEYLGYSQASYKETMGDKANMSELTLEDVFQYGVDDSLVTAHLCDLLQLRLRLEHQWSFYEEWAVNSAVTLRQAFVEGSRINWALQKRLSEKDLAAVDTHMAELRKILEENTRDAETRGCLSYIEEETPYIKKAYLKKFGREDWFAEYKKWESGLRSSCKYIPYREEEVMPDFSFTPKQLSAAAEAVGLPAIEKVTQSYLGEYVDALGLTKDNATVYEGAQKEFLDALSKGMEVQVWKVRHEPTYQREKVFDKLAEVCQRLAGVQPKTIKTGDELNVGSSDQMKKLIYCKIGVPVRLFGATVSEGRVKLGIRQASPATDEKAIRMALANDVEKGSWQERALQHLLDLKTSNTRNNLFHKKMPMWVHKDGKVHPYITDCGTDTRRPTGSNPNILQMPGHGAGSFMRSMYMPPAPDWVCVGIDFSGQELRIVASESKDPAMLEAYTPGKEKDIHSMTGVGIVQKLMCADEFLAEIANFERFNSARKDKSDPMFHKADEIRGKAKACLASGTRVLTDQGEIAIQHVKPEHKLWDGVEWVRHEGVICKGIQSVYTYAGLPATRDHKILLKNGEMKPFGEIIDEDLIDEIRVEPYRDDLDNGLDRSKTQGIQRKKVYDIVNAGPRHRFAAEGMIVANCNFLMTYLGTPPTLARNLLIPLREAEDLLDGAFSLYKEVNPWQDRVSKFMLEHGYTVTAYGTRRHATDNLFSRDKSQVSRMLRQGVNATVQGCAAESLKTILTKLHTEGWLKSLRMQFFAGVYDEVVSWVHKDDVVEYWHVMKRLMTEATPPGHAVPQVPEVSLGYSWGDMDELGSNPTDEEIEKLVSESVEAGKKVWETDMKLSWEDVYGNA